MFVIVHFSVFFCVKCFFASKLVKSTAVLEHT